MTNFRKLIAFGVVLLALGASQQAYSQAILTMPASAGGQSHKTAIALQARLAEWVGQPVIFDFRPGGGVLVGARHVMQSTAPVHLFLMLAQTQPGFEIDQLNDLVPVIELGRQTYVIYSRTGLDINSWKDLAKQKGKKFSYGMVNASGLDPYFSGLLQTMPQHQFVMVPYKSGAPMVADVVGGHVDLAMTTPSTVQQFAAENKIVPLFVTSQSRTALFPGVPTQRELGLRFANDNHTPTMYLFASKSSSPEINDRIRKAWAQWSTTEEGKKIMATLDTEPPTPGTKAEDSLRKLLGR